MYDVIVDPRTLEFPSVWKSLVATGGHDKAGGTGSKNKLDPRDADNDNEEESSDGKGDK